MFLFHFDTKQLLKLENSYIFHLKGMFPFNTTSISMGLVLDEHTIPKTVFIHQNFSQFKNLIVCSLT